ncbi:MAG: HEAT repeat domain-containing protein [Candidatus Bathyarchaeia archaeon]
MRRNFISSYIVLFSPPPLKRHFVKSYDFPLELLIPFLLDDNLEVLKEAVKKLRFYPSTQAIPLLLYMIAAPINPLIRPHVIKVLKSFPRQDLVSAFRTFAHSLPQTILFCLEHIYLPELIPFFYQDVLSRDPEKAQLGFKALIFLNSPVAVPEASRLLFEDQPRGLKSAIVDYLVVFQKFDVLEKMSPSWEQYISPPPRALYSSPFFDINITDISRPLPENILSIPDEFFHKTFVYINKPTFSPETKRFFLIKLKKFIPNVYLLLATAFLAHSFFAESVVRLMAEDPSLHHFLPLFFRKEDYSLFATLTETIALLRNPALIPFLLHICQKGYVFPVEAIEKLILWEGEKMIYSLFRNNPETVVSCLHFLKSYDRKLVSFFASFLEHPRPVYRKCAFEAFIEMKVSGFEPQAIKALQDPFSEVRYSASSYLLSISPEYLELVYPHLPPSWFNRLFVRFQNLVSFVSPNLFVKFSPETQKFLVEEATKKKFVPPWLILGI